MRLFKPIILAIVVCFAISIVGCATRPEPFDYEPDNELKKGPGLFSGEKGAFTIYREPMESKALNSTESEKEGQKQETQPSNPQ